MNASTYSGWGLSSTPSSSMGPYLAVNRAGTPFVTWMDGPSYIRQIYVKRWNGTAWVEVGAGSASGNGISLGSDNSMRAVIAFDSSDNPVVAWESISSGNWEIYIKRWNGSAWVELGAGSASGGGISNTKTYVSWNPSIASDLSGNLIVAWEAWANSTQKEIYVKRWNGSAWVELGARSASGGGISNNPGDSTYPSVTLDTMGNPVVAWSDNTNGNYEIYVKRWNGAAWVDLGLNSASNGGVSDNQGDSQSVDIAADGTGNIIVTWNDKTIGKYVIYTLLWDGILWKEIGANSASAGGISQNMGQAYAPSLVIDRSGNPIITWQDNSVGYDEIYVKRFNGTTWAEMGVRSASGGGISGTITNAQIPKIALDAQGNAIIVWQEIEEIFAKHFAP